MKKYWVVIVIFSMTFIGMAYWYKSSGLKFSCKDYEGGLKVPVKVYDDKNNLKLEYISRIEIKNCLVLTMTLEDKKTEIIPNEDIEDGTAIVMYEGKTYFIKVND